MEFNQEKAYLLGGILKQFRKRYGYSVKMVAEATNYNHGYISQLENGVKLVSEEVMDNILKIYDISFDKDYHMLEILREKLIVIYQEYIESGKSSCHIIDINEEYQNTVAIFVCKLILLFKSIIERDFEHSNQLEEFIDQYFKSLNNDEKAIFYSLKILKRLMMSENIEAEKFLEKSSELAKYSNVRGLVAMNKYHAVIIYRRLGKASQALVYSFRAYHEFLQTSNYFRLQSLDVYIANCYASLGLYEIAKEKYLKMLRRNRLKNDSSLLASTYNNLGWVCLMNEDYDECIEFSKLALEHNIDFYETKINIPYAKYRQNQHKRALKMMKDITVEDIGEHLYLFVDAISNRIQKNDKVFLEKAKQFYEEEHRRMNLDMEEIILKELLEFYQERDDYYKIIETQDKIIDLLKRRR